MIIVKCVVLKRFRRNAVLKRLQLQIAAGFAPIDRRKGAIKPAFMEFTLGPVKKYTYPRLVLHVSQTNSSYFRFVESLLLLK